MGIQVRGKEDGRSEFLEGKASLSIRGKTVLLVVIIATSALCIYVVLGTTRSRKVEVFDMKYLRMTPGISVMDQI